MLRRLRKQIYRWSGQWPNDEKLILYVGGSQRSGTTMLQEVFYRDQNARGYGETGLCDDNRQLLPFAELEKIVATRTGAIHVVKPLCSSHDIERYVRAAPTRSRALWMFRHYADVTNSDLRKWGHLQSEIRRMRAFVDYTGIEKVDEWASFGATDEVREVISRHYSEDMRPEDAAALYWWARNHLWFTTGLCDLEQSMLLSYHEIMENPEYWIRNLYRFLGNRYPGHTAIAHIRRGNGKLREVELSESVRELCESMWEYLSEEQRKQDAALQKQSGPILVPARSKQHLPQLNSGIV